MAARLYKDAKHFLTLSNFCSKNWVHFAKTNYEMKKWLFKLSILLNILFLLGWFLSWISSPSYEMGRLEKNLEIGYFTGDSTIFVLPKGLTVRNASQRGLAAIGQFENERFQIVITSSDPSLIRYDLPKDSFDTFGNYYSADVKKN